MTAAQAAAFDDRCLESSVALYPGAVILGDTTYRAAVVAGPGEAVVNAAGIQAVEALTVEISRQLLAEAPEVGRHMIEDVATGKRYEIYRVLPEASRWLIRAAIFPN